MALKFTDKEPSKPFVLAGHGNVPHPNLPTGTVLALLSLGDSSVSITDLWGKIFGGWVSSSVPIPKEVAARLGTRQKDDPIFYTVELSKTGPEAAIRFYV